MFSKLLFHSGFEKGKRLTFVAANFYLMTSDPLLSYYGYVRQIQKSKGCCIAMKTSSPSNMEDTIKVDCLQIDDYMYSVINHTSHDFGID